MEKAALKLISDRHGTVLHVKEYQYESYMIKIVDDGVDKVASIYSADVAMPTLDVEPSASMIRFPVNGYSLDLMDKVVATLHDLQNIKCILDELMAAP